MIMNFYQTNEPLKNKVNNVKSNHRFANLSKVVSGKLPPDYTPMAVVIDNHLLR